MKHRQAIQMGLFVLRTFAQDEEIQTIHLPIVFTAILDIVNVRSSTSVSWSGDLTSNSTKNFS